MKKTLNILLYSTILIIVACASMPQKRSDIKDLEELPLHKQLKPFVSDGCSMWPDGTRKKPNAWLKCCYIHDQQYWLGGTIRQRENSDKQLKQCVKKSFSNWMSVLMYTGVRAGGSAKYKTSYRWGYGWKYDRGYLPLTQKEISYAQTLLPKEGEDMWKYISKKKPQESK